MVPVPDEYFTLFIHEISPDLTSAVYSKIDQGVTVAHKKKVPAMVQDDDNLFIFGEHGISIMLASKAYVDLHGIPEEIKKKLQEGK
jgi:hypothetical protein